MPPLGRVAPEPLGLQIEAAADPVHHGLGDGDLHYTIGSHALGVDDDPGLVVDQIVRIIGKERVDARSGIRDVQDGLDVRNLRAILPIT